VSAREQRISKKYLKGKENWKEISVYGMIILKSILKKRLLILHLNLLLQHRGKTGLFNTLFRYVA
jgi:hypothetical protein